MARRERAAGQMGARGRRHARQDDHDAHARVDPRIRGSRPGLSDRRRAAQLRHLGAARRRRSISSSRPTNTTRRSSTSARNSCTTGRAPLVLNNLEYDHADIYPDVAAILCAVPSARAHRAWQRPDRRERRATRIVDKLRARGSGRRVQTFSAHGEADWTRSVRAGSASGRASRRQAPRRSARQVQWRLLGEHNSKTRSRRSRRRGTSACRRRRARSARRVQRREAPAGDARRVRRYSASSTTSPTTRPRSRPRSRACGAAAPRSASSR